MSRAPMLVVLVVMLVALPVGPLPLGPARSPADPGSDCFTITLSSTARDSEAVRQCLEANERKRERDLDIWHIARKVHHQTVSDETDVAPPPPPLAPPRAAPPPASPAPPAPRGDESLSPCARPDSREQCQATPEQIRYQLRRSRERAGSEF